MTTAERIESSVNDALGNLLRRMMPSCRLHSESTHTLEGFPGRHPDVLVIPSGRAPVVIEAEYHPARNVEAEARRRLGLDVAGTPRAIEAAIALRYPASLKHAYDIEAAIREAPLSYAVFQEDDERFPESGWMDPQATWPT